MDYRARRAELLARGEIFLDANFKPNNNSIYLDGVPRHRTYGKGPITWKRPSDIFENAAPYFLVGGSARFDLNQGAIGNCWFVAAAATLVTVSPKKFSRVVPTDQSFTSDYAGIFRFNFWWYGDWVEVCVDDYLPCDQEGILFCQNRNQPNEFWPCLLEKAYAKLHGSYEALEGGKLHHALIDFTGGMTEVFVLENPSQVPRDLINIIVNTYSMDTLMGASIYRPAGATAREVRKSNGLYMGHAYSITGVMSTGLNTQLQNGHSIVRLIRLRNPWGLGEWNGAWSDRSPEVANLSAADRQRLQLVTRHDGEFWISYDDFVREFDELQMCHMVPDAFSGEIREDTVKQEWHVAPFQGSWQHKETGCCPWLCGSVVHFDNEQYYVQLREVDETGKCTLIVSLMEKEVRTSSIDLPEILIGFSVFRLRDNNLQPLDRKYKNRAELVATAGEYEVYREMCKRFVVAPGTYVIIAQTHRPGDQADYILRLYTKKPAAVGVMSKAAGNVV